jgi:prolyl-tRNA synthetase
MRYSKLLAKTVREPPRGAEGKAYEVLVRAGFLRASSSGVLALLPLGFRVLEKMNRVVGEELLGRGAQTFAAPPPDASRLKERPAYAELKRSLAQRRAESRRHYFLAPQHEENLCVLAGVLTLSYRDLPMVLALGQWQNREDARGGASLVSARQFPMQAVYALDADAESAAQSGALLGDACRAVCERIGISAVRLPNLPELADQEAGAHAGARPAGSFFSEEYVVFSETGNEAVARCDSCGYCDRLERARSHFPPFPQDEAPGKAEAVLGKDIINTAELAAFLGIQPEKTTKCLLFEADGRPLAVCVRGEYDVSESKLAHLLGCAELRLAPPYLVSELTGAEVGYAGPIGLPRHVEVLWDLSTEGRINFEAGANKTDYHWINLNFGRELPAPSRFVDVRKVREGEQCWCCGRGRLVAAKTLQIAEVSGLGIIYSEELGAMFAGKDGKSQPAMITCCGLEMNRLLVAAVEQHSDEKGLLLPESIVPFHAHLISLAGAEARAAEVYERLRAVEIEVLWDDRQSPAGVKFADADLIGLPVRLVISPRTGDKIEWKQRRGEQTELLSPEQAIERLTRS